ncbi:MAG: Rpn family recombination-promoting nuclease/putative transposase [Planctomycetaceae bacterium]|jgi:predicted transposase/invertase (TIGR01784 family)|nr:Rpn family recombination-promoting nuclease/putative transposase [Planctomycetaceae bacterium]
MTKNNSRYFRFDWALKRLLRQKANFVILEGFLSSLLGETVRINRILESEGNKTSEVDKYNRVDVLAENSRGELIIIEVQNSRELNYFHRMLYGTSKAITEYISEGEPYSVIRKLYSVNIVYFELGQGKDYVYHGRTEFYGLHEKDQLLLTGSQQKQFRCCAAGDIYPEYYILRVDDFDKLAVDSLDEWMSFLKTGDIPDDAKAPGLPEAREIMRIDRMSPEERADYKSHLEALRYEQSVIQTGIIEGRMEGRMEGIIEGRIEGIIEGRIEGRMEGEAIGREKGEVIGLEKGRVTALTEVVLAAVRNDLSEDQIQMITGLTKEEIRKIRDKHEKQ